MSVSLTVKGYASKNSPEFQKHLKAVKFCIENDLSYPKETSEFFKGKCDGENLEALHPKYILGYIENGVEIPLPITGGNEGDVYVRRIRVADIPKVVDEIIISLIY